MTGPQHCLQDRPTKASIRFEGVLIDLTLLHLATGYSISYLSRVFRGMRHPSITTYRKVARALGMTLPDFIAALDSHTAKFSLSA